jgi:hypothetical protein
MHSLAASTAHTYIRAGLRVTAPIPMLRRLWDTHVSSSAELMTCSSFFVSPCTQHQAQVQIRFQYKHHKILSLLRSRHSASTFHQKTPALRTEAIQPHCEQSSSSCGTRRVRAAAGAPAAGARLARVREALVLAVQRHVRLQVPARHRVVAVAEDVVERAPQRPRDRPRDEHEHAQQVDAVVADREAVLCAHALHARRSGALTSCGSNVAVVGQSTFTLDACTLCTPAQSASFACVSTESPALEAWTAHLRYDLAEQEHYADLQSEHRRYAAQVAQGSDAVPNIAQPL